MKGGWSSVPMECGEQSVMMTGMIMMQLSFADNLDMTLKVTSIIYIISLLLILVYILGAKALSNAYFGAGNGSILMDDVACSGTEIRLTACSHISKHNCGHREDASVHCSPGRHARSACTG